MFFKTQRHHSAFPRAFGENSEFAQYFWLFLLVFAVIFLVFFFTISGFIFIIYEITLNDEMTLKDSIYDLTRGIFVFLTNYSKMVYVQDQVRPPLGEIEKEGILIKIHRIFFQINSISNFNNWRYLFLTHILNTLLLIAIRVFRVDGKTIISMYVCNLLMNQFLKSTFNLQRMNRQQILSLKLYWSFLNIRILVE